MAQHRTFHHGTMSSAVHTFLTHPMMWQSWSCTYLGRRFPVMILRNSLEMLKKKPSNCTLLQCQQNVDLLVLLLLPPTPTVLIKIVIPRIKPLSFGVTRTPVSNTETPFWTRTLVPGTETRSRVRHKGWRCMVYRIKRLQILPNRWLCQNLLWRLVNLFLLSLLWPNLTPRIPLKHILMMTRTTLASMVKWLMGLVMGHIWLLPHSSKLMIRS